jgi:acetolactate synthase-1/2/3 large subunit
VTKPHGKQVREAAKLISESKRPILYVGGGVLKARAWKELKELTELTGIPMVTTLMARGIFPDSHPLNMGMPGMHGSVAAGRSPAARRPADRSRYPLRRPGHRSAVELRTAGQGDPRRHRPGEISKNRTADVPIVGDCKEVIAELITLLRPDDRRPDVGEWARYLIDLKRRYPTGYDLPADGSLSPQHVIKRIGEITGPDAYYAAGVGQHQMWAAHFLPWELPGRWLNSGGLGTWATACPPPWAPRWACPTRSSGESTATVASR